MRSRFHTRSSLHLAILTFTCLIAHPAYPEDFPGGFFEQPSTAQPRDLLSKEQIQSFLPSRGKFTFPAPYNTNGIRLTNADDCNGSDCVNYVGYSYWRNTNNHVGQESILIFVGLARNQGGAGPSLIEYNKATDQVFNRGPLFDDNNALSWATGEGWYFSATRPHSLYVNSDATLLRYDVIHRTSETVFDLSNLMGDSYYIWQVHSSSDDRVHSATVRSRSTYAMQGCMVYFEATGQHDYYPRKGDYDECQVDKSGEWLLIKENVDGKQGEDNRIINLITKQERVLLDGDGAAGHSDMGFGYMVAADNYANDANSMKLWRFDADPLQGTLVYHNSDWGVSAPEHVSHGNAVPGIAPEEQYICGDSANYTNSAEANEIICFGLNGADEALVVAPVLTDLNAIGGGDAYAKSPKGNLDVTGRYFIWTTNMSSSRLDLFMVKIPTTSITVTSSNTESTGTTEFTDTSGTTDSTVSYTGTGTYTDTSTSSDSGSEAEPSPDTTSDPAAVPDADTTPIAEFANVRWFQQSNVTVAGRVLTKSAGCDGCDDAGAASMKRLFSGDNGYLEFTVDETSKLRYIGLSKSKRGTQIGKMDFALALQAGYVEVREEGQYRADVFISPGDRLRISVISGRVSYSLNGNVFYESKASPSYPMRAYARLLDMGSTASQAVIAGGY